MATANFCQIISKHEDLVVSLLHNGGGSRQEPQDRCIRWGAVHTSRVTVAVPAAGSASTLDANVACGQPSNAASIWPVCSA